MSSHRPTDLSSRLQWFQSYPGWTLVVLVLVALLPFLNKPFNADDPLFVWAAGHISEHPLNPYGFDVNWYGTVTPMWEVTKNPPFAGYYLALMAKLLGWSERALHTAMLLPALAALLGTLRLARHFCRCSLLAAVLTLATPVFLVSATTVMCDVLMLALWLWAVVFWVEAAQRDCVWRFVVAGLLIALAALTKYFGACLLPLLAAHALIRRPRLGWWCVSLLIPVAALIAYYLVTRELYGRSLLLDAAGYAEFPQNLGKFFQEKSDSLLAALAFTGGGLAVVMFFMPLLWERRRLMAISAIGIIGGLALLFAGNSIKHYGPLQGTTRLVLNVQLLFWTVGGAGILMLAVADIRRRGDADAWLLGLWVLGTLLFAALFNWTVNGRTILPMTPAVAIQLVRRLDTRWLATSWPRGAGVALAAGALLALLVARADFLFAQSARASAEATFRKHAIGTQRFWFQGHWGFQYYLNSLGALALDPEHTLLQRGDVVATPENNCNFSPLGPELVVLREIIIAPGPRWLATMKGEVGAGFYAASRGPLPFAFGYVPADRVVVCVVDPTTQPIVPEVQKR